MHAAAQPSSNLNILSQPIRCQCTCGRSSSVQSYPPQRRSRQQHQTAAAIGEPPTRASATFAETWVASARALSRQKEVNRARKSQPVTGQQLITTSTSSDVFSTASSKLSTHQHAATSEASLQQPPNAASATRTTQASHQSNLGQTSVEDTRQTFASAVDKMYRQRLREVKAMLTPDAVQQLQQELSPEELQSLQVVLQDLQDLQASWQEEDEQFNPAEQQLIQQVTSAAQIMPDDFNTYILGMLPPGCGFDEVQQLLQMLDKQLLQDLKSVYYELKEFEQADLDISVAHDRYLELSGRITEVAARMQSALAAQQQQAQQQMQQSQQQQQQAQLRPATAAMQQASQSLTSTQSSSSSSSGGRAIGSSSSSSRSWGSSWAKTAAARALAAGSSNNSSSPGQQKQQSDTASSSLGKPQQQQQGQQDHQAVHHAAYQAESSNQAAAAASRQQQQQQALSPGGRQRRRRVIRRETTSE